MDKKQTFFFFFFNPTKCGLLVEDIKTVINGSYGRKGQVCQEVFNRYIPCIITRILIQLQKEII